MAKTLNYWDINAVYSGLISDYLALGWTIHTSTMRGSQGEIGRVDLTDGKRLIRVRIEEYLEDGKIGEKGYYFLPCICITVGECKNEDVLAEIGKKSGFTTVWNQDLEVLNRYKWYAMAESSSAQEERYGTLADAWKEFQRKYHTEEA